MSKNPYSKIDLDEPSKPVLETAPLPQAESLPAPLDLGIEQERIFMDEYCSGFDLVKSAKAAKLSLNAAKALLQTPQFQQKCQAVLDARSVRTHISAQRVLNRLASIAFADPRKVLSHASTSSEDKLTQEDAALIAGIKPSKFGVEVKLHNQVEALGLLGKHLGLFKETHEHEFVFKKMGDVMIGDTALTFDIGSDPLKKIDLAPEDNTLDKAEDKS